MSHFWVKKLKNLFMQMNLKKKQWFIISASVKKTMDAPSNNKEKKKDQEYSRRDGTAHFS